MELKIKMASLSSLSPTLMDTSSLPQTIDSKNPAEHLREIEEAVKEVQSIPEKTLKISITENKKKGKDGAPRVIFFATGIQVVYG